MISVLANEKRWDALFEELTDMVERAEDNAACEGCGSTSGICYGWCGNARAGEQVGRDFFDSTRGV